MKDRAGEKKEGEEERREEREREAKMRQKCECGKKTREAIVEWSEQQIICLACGGIIDEV